jgi:hypothetical protein
MKNTHAHTRTHAHTHTHTHIELFFVLKCHVCPCINNFHTLIAQRNNQWQFNNNTFKIKVI